MALLEPIDFANDGVSSENTDCSHFSHRVGAEGLAVVLATGENTFLDVLINISDAIQSNVALVDRS